MKSLNPKKADLVGNLTRSFVLLMFFLFAHSWVYRIIGFFNKVVCKAIYNTLKVFLRIEKDYDESRMIRTIAIVYGATKLKRRLFLFDWFADYLKADEWKLTPMNIFFLNGRIGIVFATSATEDQFRRRSEVNRLGKEVEKTEEKGTKAVKLRMKYVQALEDTHRLTEMPKSQDKIRDLMGANDSRCAGLLPGRFAAHQVEREQKERDTTIVAVKQAIKKVSIKHYGIPEGITVILIGGGGYIGRSLENLLVNEDKCKVFSFDVHNKSRFREITEKFGLRGKPAVIVNLATPKAINSLINDLWIECYVLNEVYPMFNQWTVNKLEEKGIRAGHICGAKGFMLFSLGTGYWHYVPCCLAHVSDGFEVIIRELTFFDSKSRDY